jgi:hypothetical protein
MRARLKDKKVNLEVICSFCCMWNNQEQRGRAYELLAWDLARSRSVGSAPVASAWLRADRIGYVQAARRMQQQRVHPMLGWAASKPPAHSFSHFLCMAQHVLWGIRSGLLVPRRKMWRQDSHSFHLCPRSNQTLESCLLRKRTRMATSSRTPSSAGRHGDVP